MADSAQVANILAAAMPEEELLVNITTGTRQRPGLCKLLGLRWFHDQDSRRNPSGFPDLVVAGTVTLFRELKTQKGRPSTAQLAWLADLTAAGQDACIWRPEDWFSGRIHAELQAVARLRGGRR